MSNKKTKQIDVVELQERIDDLELQLEEKTKACSMWARKAMEAANERNLLWNKLEAQKSQSPATAIK